MRTVRRFSQALASARLFVAPPRARSGFRFFSGSFPSSVPLFSHLSASESMTPNLPCENRPTDQSDAAQTHPCFVSILLPSGIALGDGLQRLQESFDAGSISEPTYLYESLQLKIAHRSLSDFFAWFRRLVESGVVDYSRYHRLLQQLSFARGSAEARECFEFMLSRGMPVSIVDVNRYLISFPDARSMIRVLRNPQVAQLSPNCVTYSILLSVSDYTYPPFDEIRRILGECLKARDYPSPRAFFSYLKRLSMDPRIPPYDTCRMVQFVLQTMDRMELPMNISTFMIGIHLCSRCSWTTDAESLFESLKAHKIQPDCIAYTALIGMYTVIGNMPKALSLLAEMQSHGVAPNMITMNSLLRGCSKKGNLPLMQKLLEQFERHGLCPDVSTFNHQIYANARAGRFGECYRLFEELKSRGASESAARVGSRALRPDQRSFRGILFCSCREGDESHCLQYLRETHAFLAGNYPVDSLFNVLQTFPDGGPESPVPSLCMKMLSHPSSHVRSGQVQFFLRSLQQRGKQGLIPAYRAVFAQLPEPKERF